MIFVNKKILITGGNSGIGRALAEALKEKGNKVIITGRKEATLSQVLSDNPEMEGYVLDVTQSGAVATFSETLLAEHPDLDAVILNAGIMEPENYTAQAVDTDVADRTIATNLIAPIHLAAALLPHLRGRPESALVTVSSGLAFVPRAENPVYSATKAAIHSWSQSLRHQLRGTSVAVHEIAPPLVATELTPGQSTWENALSLEAFTKEVIAILSQDEVPDEILVQRVSFQRNAEKEDRFASTFATINA
ncbi:SDR family oxidoreductase [Pantoea sp. GM01]|uniref:SDR family oxidoreductase n=1 Tax=Pantoea sp. GM01 TaxID=1144320 RepID=UPI000270F7EC|nr:SDR family NAD(P)-dependent oxidoreductase [Pantoea sp. GM01]EJL93208.1 short-chain dehydrogenase, teichoic and lipoteichoic acid D-alanine esterification [Pantoea sp. GM01]